MIVCFPGATLAKANLPFASVITVALPSSVTVTPGKTEPSFAATTPRIVCVSGTALTKRSRSTRKAMRFMATSFAGRRLHARCRACRAHNCCARNGVTDPQRCHETARPNFYAKFANGDNARAMISFLFATLLAAAPPAKPTPPPDLNKPPADALNIGNGLITKQLVPGKSAEMPSGGDLVKARYRLWSSPDGNLVDH